LQSAPFADSSSARSLLTALVRSCCTAADGTRASCYGIRHVVRLGRPRALCRVCREMGSRDRPDATGRSASSDTPDMSAPQTCAGASWGSAQSRGQAGAASTPGQDSLDSAQFASICCTCGENGNGKPLSYMVTARCGSGPTPAT
jgi:hypothetical protein